MPVFAVIGSATAPPTGTNPGVPHARPARFSPCRQCRSGLQNSSGVGACLLSSPVPPLTLIRTFIQAARRGDRARGCRGSMVRIYAIPSASMLPTLQVGDHIVVVRDGGPRRARRRRVSIPPPPTTSFWSRHRSARPATSSARQTGALTIGGHALVEPYLAEVAAAGSIARRSVPANSLTSSVGDNRGNSSDSRQWGVLPRDLLVGRAMMVLCSGRQRRFRSALRTPRPSAPSPLAPGPAFGEDLPADSVRTRPRHSRIHVTACCTCHGLP